MLLIGNYYKGFINEFRPAHDCNWAYFFFIDIEGHHEDVPVKRALEELGKKSIILHILGSYPKACVLG